MASEPIEQSINLQVGDIIEFVAPTDSKINAKPFLIKYIDKEKLDLLGQDGTAATININEDGTLRNESIQTIAILSRADSPSYARQNGLVPSQWIDLYFGGELPVIMTGLITNLDEDQIEIKLVDDETIYIDFKYNGIPSDLPIEKIVKRETPTQDNPADMISPIPEKITTPTSPEEEDEEIIETTEEDALTPLPEPEFRERVKNVIIAADQIQFGEKLGAIAMMVEVPEDEKRYGIDKQATDLLNEMLSDIPNAERTQTVLNNIHRMIERFKQLRTQFSKFDTNGNAQMPDIQGADFKPLVQSLEVLNQKLYWILPVVRNTKKLYDVDEEVAKEYNDVDPETLAAIRTAETEVIRAFNQGEITDGQNGYDYMIKSVDKYWTPFGPPDSENGTITTQRVESNLTAIVDNLYDFYSSVSKNDNIKRKRFLIQEYNLGMNTLETQRVAGGGEVIKIKRVTRPDEMSIKSFLTLPESVVRFSHVNLPSTNIMMKCNLSRNHLSYWRMLNKLTSVTVKSVGKEPVEFDENKYLEDVREYLPNEYSETDYKTYLENIIPKTRVLFNLIKKHITGTLSINAVLSYLEPFLVYQRDLSFMQYQEITEFISDKITNWKKDYVIKKRDYEQLTKAGVSRRTLPLILDLLRQSPEANVEVNEGYRFDKVPLDKYSDGEIINLMNKIDSSRYFNDVIAMMSSDLMLPDGMATLLEKQEFTISKSTAQTDNVNNKACSTRVLSKKYLSIDELADDNGKDISYDKQFDKTYYDVINSHQAELDIIIEESSKIAYLQNKISESTGMSTDDAKIEAEAMILGYRPVKDGDYALVSISDDQVFFYKRRDNTWIRDESIPETTMANSNALFCNLAEKCISINDDCVALPAATIDMQQNAIKDMTKEFSERLKLGSKAIDEKIMAAGNNAAARLTPLITLLTREFTKNDTLMFELGASAKEVVVEKSPHAGLLSLILSQSDFVKRQNNITQFVAYYTRPANPEEDKWWLYCNTSNVKLLPTFVSKLADVYVSGGNYFYELQLIADQQGEEGGDGEAIVDQYSGWIITRIDFSTEEGFTEEGFVMRSRDVMEADIGNAIAQAPNAKKETFGDPESEKISRVMRAISRYMGLNTNALEEFVISQTAKLLAKSMPARQDYENAIAAQKGKKREPDPYDIVYDQTLILLTLSFLLIGIQTSIPSLRTRKTYPGCVKSFSGYPVFGNGDDSGIEYIACVTDGIKSSIEPWNSIKKLSQRKIVSKMKSLIDKFIIASDVIQERIVSKSEYDAINQEEYIPADLDITNWINFLPPLKPVNVSVLPPSKEFQEQFLTDIKRGSKGQFEKINALRSKIIYLALSIETAVQKVVTKNIADHQAILSNAAKIPFLENACCNENNDETYKYFSDKERSINIDNNIVRDLRAVLDDVGAMSKASILFDPTDTRIEFPNLPPEFDEETIYRAFMVYCKYNSDIPISEELRAICMDKPDDFNISDSIKDKIKKLKRDGRNFDNETLARLMSIINKNNIVSLDIRSLVLSNIQRLRDRLSSVNDSEVNILPTPFINGMLDVIDRFGVGDLPADKDTDEVRSMKNYLQTVNDQMQSAISDFVRRNNAEGHAKFAECLTSITEFRPDPSSNDSTVFQMANFAKSVSWLISRVFPNIIINEVAYNNVKVPPCWNLSDQHQQDIRSQARDHYSPLSKFYGDSQIKSLLQVFQFEGRQLWAISDDTMYIAPVNTPEGVVQSVFDDKMVKYLFKFYILNALINMMELVDREDFYDEKLERPSNPLLREQVDVVLGQEGRAPMLEIMSGEKKLMSEKIAGLMTSFMSVACQDKKVINLNYEDLMEKVTRGKEKEKDQIVEFLTELTDEEREIENMFKNHRIGRWSVGMQKGFRVYEGDTYDQERSAMEERTIREARLNQIDGVTKGLMDVFELDAIVEENEARMIEDQEFAIDYNGEDDNIRDADYGDEL
uniref:Uncharacterized protein n=1 Tax=viral metagenome TaxID=1070528 RepID=A0A6C0LI81_9ZZZZ